MAVDSRPTLTTSAAASGSVAWTLMAILVAIPVALPLLVVVRSLVVWVPFRGRFLEHFFCELL